MKYFGKSSDQFVILSHGLAPGWKGKRESVTIAQDSWTKYHCHLYPEVEKEDFYLFVCFVMKWKSGLSVEGQGEQAWL